MSDTEKLPNRDGSEWESLDSKIPKTKRQALARILGLFSSLPLRWQLAFAVAGLGVAGFCGYKLQSILFNNQANVARTLAATMVSTAYPHRGVTAFLVAELDKNVPAQKLNSTLRDAVLDIKKVIEITSTENFDEQKQNDVIKDLDFEVTDKPDLHNPVMDQGHTWTKIIQSKKKEHENAFLMVPAISVRQAMVGNNELQTNTQINSILKYNKEILFDFYLASQIDQKLKLLGKLDKQPLTVVQAYFISESGVILLRQVDTDKSYTYTFPNNTLFMDRLYFWGAINPHEFSHQKNEGGPLEYATDPYIDLGGNGVVITFSQRVELPNKRNGVVCVDVALPPGTDKQIEQRLKDLGADEVLQNTLISKEKTFRGALPDAFNWIHKALADGPTSRITGAIAFESDFPANGVTSSDDQVVRFTVPIGSADPNHTTDTKLLLVTFDFRSRRNWIIGYSVGFAVGIGLFMVVVANVLLRFFELQRQMNRVLENMSTVMYEAATPFVWLNENNEFVKVNISFLHALGCDTEHELVNHASKFRDLVTAESVPHYEAILQMSARGEPTPKYRITIKKVNGEKVSVWVHGERVPSPSLGKKRSPDRFGVFLPDQTEPGTANRETLDELPNAK